MFLTLWDKELQSSIYDRTLTSQQHTLLVDLVVNVDIHTEHCKPVCSSHSGTTSVHLRQDTDQSTSHTSSGPVDIHTEHCTPVCFSHSGTRNFREVSTTQSTSHTSSGPVDIHTEYCRPVCFSYSETRNFRVSTTGHRPVNITHF